MKHLLTLMALLAIFFSFNSQAYVFEGRVVNQGSTLECMVENYSNYNIFVLEYKFNMTVRDNFGRTYPLTQSLACVNNCMVTRGSYQLLLGANIAYNVLAARCYGTYVIQ
jgi:hypothetical protein